MQDTTHTASIKEAFPWLSERPSGDCAAFNCPPGRIVALMRGLRDDFAYRILSDLTALDWGLEASPRFTVFYHLYSLDRHEYLRVAVDCVSSVEPQMPSLCSLWSGANWLEREVFDMFGISFAGHPDLRRILMWDNYPFHPMRKDFPLAGLEAPLPDEDPIAEEILGGNTMAAPMAGGPFRASCGNTMSEAEPRARDESWNEKKPKPSE
ncbi:MAG: NADH-quinone oxidoreductase subunit C [Opitutales bacterium]|jgi:NADH-quinone oxidoreductase subunit C